MRAPQWPQYGRLGSTARSHRGHNPVRPLNAAAMGLTSAGMTAEPAAPASAAAIGELPVVMAPRARDADVVSGLPQSMQNRADVSFSRPQKAQTAVGLTVGESGTCGANIRAKPAVGPAPREEWCVAGRGY